MHMHAHVWFNYSSTLCTGQQVAQVAQAQSGLAACNGFMNGNVSLADDIHVSIVC